MVQEFFGTWGLTFGWALTMFFFGWSFWAILKANRFAAKAPRDGNTAEIPWLLRGLFRALVGLLIAFLLTTR